MGKSARLRLSDVRGAFRLVGECRDLGRHPDAWLAHLFAGLRPLLDAQLAVGAVQRPGGSHRGQTAFHLGGSGWLSPVHHVQWLEYMHSDHRMADPAYHRLRERWRPQLTLRREELLTRREYHATDEFNTHRRNQGVDDYIGMDVRWPDGPAALNVVVNRRLGGSVYSERERRLLHVTGMEVARLLGHRLAVGPDRLRTGLSARLVPVLDALLEGDSEKQIAARLGLSRHTVHEYVGILYRRYDVHSRAELMAHFAG